MALTTGSIVQLLVIKGQANLQPASQLALVARFDPKAQQVHGHGNVSEANKVLKTGKRSIVSQTESRSGHVAAC